MRSTASRRLGGERHTIRGRATAHLVRLGVHAPVRDLALGGFALESPRALELGSEHEVLLRHSRHVTPPLRARVVHQRWLEERHGIALHVVGFEFVEPETAARRSIVEALLRDLGVSNVD